MKLHCFGESGHSYKCALALELTGQPWEAAYVDFFNGGARAPDFLEINAMGECPALEDGSTVVTQSPVILEYIAEKAGALGGDTPEEWRDIRRWMAYDISKVSGVAGPLRFQMNFLPAPKRNEDVIGFHAMRLASALKVLNNELDDKDWITLGRPTIADLALCSYLYYPEPFTFTREDYPNIDRWLTRISALPGWKHPYDLMPGSPADRA